MLLREAMIGREEIMRVMVTESWRVVWIDGEMKQKCERSDRHTTLMSFGSSREIKNWSNGKGKEVWLWLGHSLRMRPISGEKSRQTKDLIGCGQSDLYY